MNAYPNPCNKKTVYFWEPTQTGVLEEIWSGAGNAAPHGNVRDIFSGTTHINGAPDVSTVVANWNNNTANDPSNGTDQFQYSGWVYIPAAGTQLRDTNPNSGEKLRIFIGRGSCPANVVYESDVDTNGTNTGTGGPFFTADNEGWHYIVAQGSDFSAFGGFNLQMDNAGNNAFTNYNGPTSIGMPTLGCRQELCDYVLLDGEYDCPQSITCDSNVNDPSTSTTTQNTRQVDYSQIAEYNLTGDANASADEELTLTPIREDAVFSESGDRVTYSGPNADYVELEAGVFVDDANNGGKQRTAPEAQIILTRGGVDTILDHTATGYQRHASEHNNSSNGPQRLSGSIQTGDVFRVRARQGSVQDDTSNVTLGHFTIKVVEKVIALTP